MTGAGYNASGKFGQSLNTGSGTIPMSLLPASNAPWTILAWVKRSAVPGSVVVAVGSVGTFWMGSQATGGLAQARYGTGANEVTLASTVNICDGAFHQLALVGDPATGVKFLVDGTLVASSATTMAAATPSRANVIGINTFGGGGNAWGGEVDEVSLWSAALYTADFTPQTETYTGAEANLIGLWRLDGNGTDSSGAVAATAVTLSGPTTGAVGAASTAFSVGANGIITGTVVVTPTPVAGVTFAPTSVSINSASPTATFTATASSAGAKTIAVTNDGSLANPSNITYTASASGAGFDQTKVVFSPLNWNVSAGNAKTINPGAYFRTIFGGTSCTLQFDMTGILTPLPQISYRVDGYGAWTTVDIAASVALTIPSDTAGWANAGGRLLEVRFKSMTETQLRWATQATAVVLVGIVLDATKTLTLPTKLPRSMLFLGDSITEGDRTVKIAGTPDLNSHDAFLGWAPEVARLMGFEFGVVGFSAQGAVQAGVGGVPALTSTYNFLYSGVARSFAAAPDVIVINIGTNDSTDITSAMTTVLNGLLAATPKTTRIVVLRPFNGTARSAQLQAAIAASTAPTRCLFVDTNGFFVTSKSSDSLHPFGNANLGDIAPAIVNAIQAFVAPIRGARTARTIGLPLFQDVAGTVPAVDATGLVWSFFDQTSADGLTVAADSGTTAAISGGALSLSVFSTKAAGQQGYLVLTNADGSKAFRGVVTLS